MLTFYEGKEKIDNFHSGKMVILENQPEEKTTKKGRSLNVIKFTIKVSPITKKNHQEILRNFKTGKPYVSPSPQYKQYERDAMWFIPKGIYINEPVNIKCLFYMPTKRKCDLTNLLEAIDDVMVKAGLLADDSYDIIEGHDGSRVFIDKNNPRTEVEIQFLKKEG